MTELDTKMELLKKMAYDAMRDHNIRNLASMLTHGKTAAEKAYSIYNFVKNNIHYVPERWGRDVAIAPAALVNLGYGDCEDTAMLISSLAKLSGLGVRAKVTSSDGKKYTHIYPEFYINGRWIPADTTVSNFQLGVEAPYNIAKTYAL